RLHELCRSGERGSSAEARLERRAQVDFGAGSQTLEDPREGLSCFAPPSFGGGDVRGAPIVLCGGVRLGPSDGGAPAGCLSRLLAKDGPQDLRGNEAGVQ